MDTKHCPGCNTTLPTSEFYTDRNGHSRSKCKNCAYTPKGTRVKQPVARDKYTCNKCYNALSVFDFYSTPKGKPSQPCIACKRSAYRIAHARYSPKAGYFICYRCKKHKPAHKFTLSEAELLPMGPCNKCQELAAARKAIKETAAAEKVYWQQPI